MNNDEFVEAIIILDFLNIFRNKIFSVDRFVENKPMSIHDQENRLKILKPLSIFANIDYKTCGSLNMPTNKQYIIILYSIIFDYILLCSINQW